MAKTDPYGVGLDETRRTLHVERQRPVEWAVTLFETRIKAGLNNGDLPCPLCRCVDPSAR